MHKSKLKEIFFSFRQDFLKTILQEKGIFVPEAFSTSFVSIEKIDLLNHFTFFDVGEFVKFWKENDINLS